MPKKNILFKFLTKLVRLFNIMWLKLALTYKSSLKMMLAIGDSVRNNIRKKRGHRK